MIEWADQMKGSIAGKYDLVRKIASGGMAEVFLARQTGPEGFGKLVVLKRIHPHLASKPEFVRMFLNEAKLAAELHHANVVDVYEVGDDGGSWFIAMEYLRGWDLRRLQVGAVSAGTPIPLGPCLKIIADAASGLDHAHKTLSLVHRDVSPQNVIVTWEGIAKVVDFGIARAKGQVGETEPGMVRGKLNYMSPEQVRGETVGPASDQFSLGVILFELTTMRRFLEPEGGGAITISNLAQGQIPRPSLQVPEYPKTLEAILMRALAANPGDRYPDCASFAEAIEDYLERAGVAVSASRTARFLRSLFGSDFEDTAGTPARAGTPAPAAETADRADGRDSNEPLSAALRRQILARSEARKTNLPEDGGWFVGREAESAAIAKKLDAGARLVTVTGPGGAGKTRLAMRVARGLGEKHPGGVWFCDLTEARSADGICRSVAASIDIPMVAETDAVQQLGIALAGRGRTLLLLDNFEQVVAEGPATVGRWRTLAPECTFLVTSRERLNLADETTVEVSSLPVPEEGDASESEAVQLFLRRAREIRPGYEPAPADREAIARIVRELDGIPLAIELAAGRMGVLSAQTLLERLPRRFDLLKGAQRETSARQATLRNAIEWSWNLLQPWERETLAQASVFRGGFDLAAAEAAIDERAWRARSDGRGSPEGDRAIDLAGDPQAPWLLDILGSLRDKSLLRTWEPAGFPGEMRFGMYVNVREYAASQLRDAAAVHARHAAHYLDAAADWAAAVHGHGGIDKRRRLALELENLIAIVERSLAASDATRALEGLRVLDPVLSARGPYETHLDWLDRAIAIGTLSDADPLALARARCTRGRLLRIRGRAESSEADLRTALETASARGDRALEAEALGETGKLVRDQGRGDEARAALEKGLTLARALGDRRREGLLLTSLAAMSHGPGMQDRADALYRESLEIFRSIGDRLSEANVLHGRGYLLLQRRRLPEAVASFEKAIAIHREIGDRRAQGDSEGTLAAALVELDRLADAETHYQRGIELSRQVGNRRTEGIHSGSLAVLELVLGKLDEAERLFDHAVDELRHAGDPRMVAVILGFRGALFARRRRVNAALADFEEGRRLLKDKPGGFFGATVELLASTVDAALADQMKDTDPERAEALLATIGRAILDAESSPVPSIPPLVDQSEDVRMAVRLVKAAVRG